jgi:hypothetical protein
MLVGGGQGGERTDPWRTPKNPAGRAGAARRKRLRHGACVAAAAAACGAITLGRPRRERARAARSCPRTKVPAGAAGLACRKRGAPPGPPGSGPRGRARRAADGPAPAPRAPANRAPQALARMLQPFASWAQRRYQAGLAEQLKDYGLRYDDLYDPLMDLVGL